MKVQKMVLLSCFTACCEGYGTVFGVGVKVGMSFSLYASTQNKCTSKLNSLRLKGTGISKEK